MFVSLVVPAYNEEERLGGMLEEAVDYLQSQYGDAHAMNGLKVKENGASTRQKASKGGKKSAANGTATGTSSAKGWEILIVDDGSTDKTVDTALAFAKEHQLSTYPKPQPGPRTPHPDHSTHIPHGSIRVVSLEENRGKGGAVVHGMRHVRGEYAIFADADGASRFEDLGKLVQACTEVSDSEGRAVAVGSRAHLVGSEAVVKVSISSPQSCLLKPRPLTLQNTSPINPPIFLPLRFCCHFV